MENNWAFNPNKKQMITVVCVYCIAMLLNLLTMTNLFTESPFNSKYVIIYFIILLATITTFTVVTNYFKFKKF